MPHLALVTFSELRVGTEEALQFGMSLPGLRSRADTIGQLPSLGLLTLAGMLPEHWTCSYHESRASDNLAEEVLTAEPDIVAVSALTASILPAYEFCQQLRTYGIPTVIGGLHATAMPEEAEQYACSVCVGDGEASLLQVLKDFENGALKPVYRPGAPFDFRESPRPAFELALHNKTPQRWTLQTQRGCPLACEFCGASRLLGPARFKPVDRLANELSYLKTLDSSPWIELADDNTFAGRKDSFEMLEVLQEGHIKYFTESDWRIAEHPDLLQKIADSGCVQILVGFESIPFRYPGMGKKYAELQKIQDAIATIQDFGIAVNGCFILGAEGETNQSIDRLIEFVNASELSEVQLTLQTPFPGTALYRRLQQSGRLLENKDWNSYTLFDVVYQPDSMSVHELESGFRRAMKTLFDASGNRRRRKMRRQTWAKHPQMSKSRHGAKHGAKLNQS